MALPILSNKRVVIFGLGDFARIANVYLSVDSPYEPVAFTVNRAFQTADSLSGLPVVPFEELSDRYPPDEFAMFVAIGFSRRNHLRAEMYEACKAKGYDLLSYVNSKATFWDDVNAGDNCFVFENNVIQPFVTLGNDVILWSGNHIGHDSTIGDHCFLASHVVISGNVTIRPHCFVGVNATIRDGVTIGAGCIIGAGAVILKDTGEDEVYAATPTQPLPKRASEINF